MKKLISLLALWAMVFCLCGCSASVGLHRNGKRHFDNGNYQQAAQEFSNAIDENSNKAIYYIDYGFSLIALGQYNEALEQFEHVYMDKDIKTVLENNKRALRGKGVAYYMMRDYNQALDKFNQALEIDVLHKLDVDILYYKGSILVATGDYEDAREIYTELLTEFGENPQTLSYRGYVNWQLGDYEEAIKDYDLAISLDKDNFQWYFEKYHMMVDIGDDVGANDVLELASNVGGSSKEDKFQLAKINFYQGEYDKAFRGMSEAYDNGFVEAYYYIGEIHRINGEYDSARYYYDIVIDNSTIVEPGFYNQVASSLMEIGEYEKALEYIKEGVKVADLETIRTLSKNEIVALENIGKYDKAKEKLQKYIENYPDDNLAQEEIIFVESRLKHD